MPSSLPKSCCFTLMFSTIASMTRSASETASSEFVVVTRLANVRSTRLRWSSSESGWALRATRVSDFSMIFRPFATAASETSVRTTCCLAISFVGFQCGDEDTMSGMPEALGALTQQTDGSLSLPSHHAEQQPERCQLPSGLGVARAVKRAEVSGPPGAGPGTPGHGLPAPNTVTRWMDGSSFVSEALSLPVVVDSSARPGLDEDALSMFGVTRTRRGPHRRVPMRASIVPNIECSTAYA